MIFCKYTANKNLSELIKALDRVTLMVRNPEAHDQYMRIVTNFENIVVLKPNLI